MGEFGKGPELQARQHWRAATGNVDRKPIPNEVAVERDNCALRGQVIPDRMTRVSTIGGNTKAALDFSLPLAYTRRKTKASLGSELDPFLLHPLEISRKLLRPKAAIVLREARVHGIMGRLGLMPFLLDPGFEVVGS